MKKTIKIYGVYGFMEINILVTLCGKKYNIPFRGGVSNSNGVIPATYKTDNPVLQFAIEENIQFKSGKIKLVSESEYDNGKKPVGTVAAKTEPKVDPVLPKAEAKTEVAVTCMEDAVEYLKEHFEGYTTSKLRSKVSVEQAALEHDIVFVGL